MFYIELVWNREFDWVLFGNAHPTKDKAILVAQSLMNSGDGESIKKARIVDQDGNVVVPSVSC